MIKTTIKRDDLELDDLDLTGVADALADNLKAAVSREGWVESGTLLAGIRSSDDAVTIPAGYLTRDPALAQKFADEVMPSQPLASDEVREAIQEAIVAAIKVER